MAEVGTGWEHGASRMHTDTPGRPRGQTGILSQLGGRITRMFSRQKEPTNIHRIGDGRFAQQIGYTPAFSDRSTASGAFDYMREFLVDKLDPGPGSDHRRQRATDMLSQGSKLTEEQAEDEVEKARHTSALLDKPSATGMFDQARDSPAGRMDPKDPLTTRQRWQPSSLPTKLSRSRLDERRPPCIDRRNGPIVVRTWSGIRVHLPLMRCEDMPRCHSVTSTLFPDACSRGLATGCRSSWPRNASSAICAACFGSLSTSSSESARVSPAMRTGHRNAVVTTFTARSIRIATSTSSLQAVGQICLTMAFNNNEGRT